MQIIDPTQGRPSAFQLPAEAASRLSGRVCLLSNAKPNAAELLTGIANSIESLRNAPLFVKLHASLPASRECFEQIERDYESVLVALGD